MNSPSLCLAVTLALVGLARAAEEATPEATAKRQIEALRALDFAKAARYTHPRALAQMKSLFLPVALAGATKKDNPAAAELMRVVFAGKSADELAAEKPEAFFQIVMNGIAGATGDFKRSMSGMEVEILGHVDEGEFTAHVVYRLSRAVPGGVTSKIAVTTVERDGSVWKAMLNADLENVVRAITARLQTP